MFLTPIYSNIKLLILARSVLSECVFAAVILFVFIQTSNTISSLVQLFFFFNYFIERCLDSFSNKDV